jgi:isoamylase
LRDIAWFTMEGTQKVGKDWDLGYVKSLAVFFNGMTIPNPNPFGEPVTDDNFYVIFNAHHEPLDFTLPGADWGDLWIKELDTKVGWAEKEESFRPGDRIKVEARSMVVLRHGS